MKHLKLLLVIIGVMVFANVPAATNEYGLHQAVLDNNVQLVKRLLSKGVAIDVIGSRKYGYGSALHLAVREGHVEIAQVLLERGAQVDVLDPDDFTPLHNAAWNGNLEMTKLLLDAGADINASTYDGDTPLKLAQNNDQAQVAEFIQAKLQPSASSEVKVESVATNDTGVIDISGTYLVDASGDSQLIRYILSGFAPLKKEGRRVFEIVQNGDEITVTISVGTREYGQIYGVMDGNTLNMKWVSAKSKMTVKPGGKELVGTVVYTGGSGAGTGNVELKLTKIETETAQVVDISGTYISETTVSSIGGSGPSESIKAFIKKNNRKEFTLEQTGNAIIGVGNPRSSKINGTREGNTINFYINLGNQINGTWEINADGTEMVGKWSSDGGGGASGTWNLKRRQ